MVPKDLRAASLRHDPYFRGFHQLMAKRVRNILMVSSHYESFIIARDASLAHDIYGTSQLLHLQNVPQITTASSGKDAMRILEEERFDLVLASAHLPDIETSEFARQVRAQHPDTPVVMLVFDGRWFDRTYGGAEPEGVDQIFAWRGTAGVLLSIIKLVEDSKNVERDLSLASIGILIVVEDSVGTTSLPHLYTTDGAHLLPGAGSPRTTVSCARGCAPRCCWRALSARPKPSSTATKARWSASSPTCVPSPRNAPTPRQGSGSCAASSSARPERRCWCSRQSPAARRSPRR